MATIVNEFTGEETKAERLLVTQIRTIKIETWVDLDDEEPWTEDDIEHEATDTWLEAMARARKHVGVVHIEGLSLDYLDWEVAE